MSYENVKQLHMDEYGIHINRTRSLILTKNLISGIVTFDMFWTTRNK